MRHHILSLLFLAGCHASSTDKVQEYFADQVREDFIRCLLKKPNDLSTCALPDGYSVNDIGSRGVSIGYWFFAFDEALDREIFNRLLELGMDPKLIMPSREKAIFHLAATIEDTFYLNYFLTELGIDPDLPSAHQFQPTALFHAAGLRRHEAVDLLIRMGADVHKRNHWDENVLKETLANNWRVAAILLEAGADPTVPFYNSGNTIVWALENNRYYEDVIEGEDWRRTVVNLLEEKGIKVDLWQPPEE